MVLFKNLSLESKNNAIKNHRIIFCIPENDWFQEIHNFWMKSKSAVFDKNGNFINKK